jgi:TonB family protein
MQIPNPENLTCQGPSGYPKPSSAIYHRKMLEVETMPEVAEPDELSQNVDAPRLLVELPSRSQVFFTNLRDLFFPPRLPQLELRSAPAPFWHDVFVQRRLPWLSFLESGGFHVIAIALLLAITRFLALHPQAALRPAFDHSQVVYYAPSEYLPPIDTRRPRSAAPAKADPEYARQTIISVPPEADNDRQTIVTPPNIRLKRDVALPNIVAWADTAQKPRLAIPDAPLTLAAELTRIAPTPMQNSVVAPPPDASHFDQRRSQSLQTAVVAPPPVVDNASTRQIGDINIGRSSIIAPAPQLPVAEQRTARGRGVGGVAPQVVPPPPSVASAGSSGTGSPGRVIALNLHPAVGAPPAAPPGNRRGAFAATPEGHAGASGSPGTSSSSASAAEGNGAGASQKGKNNLPAGLYVGSAASGAKPSSVAGNPSGSNASTSNPAASAAPRSNSPAHTVAPDSAAKLTEPEREVFGGRKLYALTVNMPNLNSAGGSWVIHFAELNQDPSAPVTNLGEPIATRKVDPSYPSQLMHENVAGTVIVYAVIHADGTVGNIRVLRGVDDRLDRFACNAVSQWHFQPATKNGTAVDVEATFHIPFHPSKLGTNF